MTAIRYVHENPTKAGARQPMDTGGAATLNTAGRPSAAKKRKEHPTSSVRKNGSSRSTERNPADLTLGWGSIGAVANPETTS